MKSRRVQRRCGCCTKTKWAPGLRRQPAPRRWLAGTKLQGRAPSRRCCCRMTTAPWQRGGGPWQAAGRAVAVACAPARRAAAAAPLSSRASLAAAEARSCASVFLRRLPLRALPGRASSDRPATSSRRRVRTWHVALAAEALRWHATGSIRRPAISARRELARAAARRWRIAMAPRTGKLSARNCLRANYPAIHAVGRASAEAPRLFELPLDRRRGAHCRASRSSARACALTPAGWI